MQFGWVPFTQMLTETLKNAQLTAEKLFPGVHYVCGCSNRSEAYLMFKGTPETRFFCGNFLNAPWITMVRPKRIH
jgi:hypothetical protein